MTQRYYIKLSRNLYPFANHTVLSVERYIAG